MSIPKLKNKGSCLYQNGKIRGHVYTREVENVTHVFGTSVLTATVKDAPPGFECACNEVYPRSRREDFSTTSESCEQFFCRRCVFRGQVKFSKF